MCGSFWGAHGSLAPRARTLLGGLGQATLSFFAVATLLFVFFGECPKFCDLANQRRKIVGGVSEVGKDNFSLYFFRRCVIFLVLFFSSARSACIPPLLAGVCGPGVCFGSGLGCAPPLLAGVLGCEGARVVSALLVPRHSWLGCWGVCVVLCPLRLHPATPGWVVPCGCVCSGSGFGCAPPLLAGVLRCVCSHVRAPLLPCHSWLGCAVWVCAWARVSAAPRHSWLGCLVCVCVFGLGFGLRPATPGLGVGLCVCLCARSACTPPLLAGVCGVGVCAWARVSAAPSQSRLGCSGVCVFVCALRLYPATPGWVVRRGCVCLGSGATSCFGCTPPLRAGVLGCVCVCVPAPLVPRQSWLGCVVWVCVCTQILAAPSQSWPGCWGVCVFVCPLRLYPATLGWGVWCGCVFRPGFWLRPTTPGWGFGVCVCLRARSACTPPLLAGVCGVGVCAWASGFGCAPPLLAGMLGCVCVCVRASLVPRHSWLGFVVCGFGVAWHPFLCRGSLHVLRAARVCGTRWPLLLGSCPYAVVVAGGVPLWRASWPRVGAPRLVLSGPSRCSGRLS